MGSAMEVGQKLVDLCREGKNLEAVDTLYDENIVSLEAMEGPEMPQRIEGIDAVRSKNKWFMENHEVHSERLVGPYPHGDRFIVEMHIDVTPKVGPKAGERMEMEEAALYTVRDGKIIQEEFFYPPMGA